MPLNGSDVASRVSGAAAVANTVAESAKYNSEFDDVYAILNSVRSIAKGYTGASTAVGAHDNIVTKGVDVASASTLNLDTATGALVNVTGTTTVTAVTLGTGKTRIVRATDAFQMTAGASLIINGSTSVNYTTTAGDLLFFEGYGSSVVRVWVIGQNSGYLKGFEHIREDTFSSDTDWSITGLSAYRDLLILLRAIPATDGVAFYLRTSTNNGSSYDSAGGSYTYQRVYGFGSTVASDGTSTNAFDIGVTGSIGNSSEGVWCVIHIQNFNKTDLLGVNAQTMYYNTSGAQGLGHVIGTRNTTTARNALQVFFSSGNIASGYGAIFGVRG